MGSAPSVARAAALLVGAANEAEVEGDRTREAKGDVPVPEIDEVDPESARDHVDEDDEQAIFKAICMNVCVYEITYMSESVYYFAIKL